VAGAGTAAVSWTADANALDLLEVGSPFGTSGFRRAVVQSLDGWRDMSFGARADDGTLVAVPILVRHRTGDSVPPSGYGGIVASRPIDAQQASAVLEMAFHELGLRRLIIRLLLDIGSRSEVGQHLALASVVQTARPGSPEKGFSRLARRSLRKATSAGARVEAGADADAFWSVYSPASARWATRYPEALIRLLIEREVARVHAVYLQDRVVAVLLTLVRGSHWMCWLAGQTDEGRGVAASYLAYDAVFAEAHAAGVSCVNLGASIGGGAEFKQHLGASPCPMRVWTAETASGRLLRKAGEGQALGRSLVRRVRTAFQ
jgi:hypothetical protein